MSCLNILVSEPLFWGSGHGQVTVPVNISVSLCSDKKGQVLRHDLPSRVQSWQSQSSAASALSAGSSDLSQPSSLREPGAKPKWRSGSSGRPCGGGCGSRSCRWHPRQTVLPGGGRGGERVTASSRPGPAIRGHSEGSGGQQDTALHIFPGPPDHRWSEAGLTGAPLRGGQD